MKIKEALEVKKFESIWEKVRLNLAFTNQWVEGKTNTVFANKNLTFKQYQLLKIIDENKKITQSEIVNKWVSKNADLSRIIGRLKTAGFIKSKRFAKDKRIFKLSVTPLGKESIYMFRKTEKRINETFYNLSKKEARELSKLLDKLRG